jgi:hypothetical protein
MKKLVRAEGKRHDRIGKVPRTRLGNGLLHSRRAELLPQKVANDRGPDKLSLTTRPNTSTSLCSS